MLARIVGSVLLLVLWAAISSAQEQLSTNQPFNLVWTHDGQNVAEFRIWTQTAQTTPVATVPASALVNGTASYQFASGLPNGTYQVGVSAKGEGGESERMLAHANGVVVSTPTSPTPNPPGSVTIVKDQQAAATQFLQVEDFDQGTEGVAYHDTTAGNSGGKYRSTNVDIESTTDTGGGHNVGWTAAGEWLKFTISVTTAGTYDLGFRVAALSAGGVLHLEINGVNVTGPITVPQTSGWQTWRTVTKTNVVLSAGTQTWRLVVDNPGFNVNWMSATHRP